MVEAGCLAAIRETVISIPDLFTIGIGLRAHIQWDQCVLPVPRSDPSTRRILIDHHLTSGRWISHLNYLDVKDSGMKGCSDF